ncbi:MAG: hypothetical protein AB7T01_02120 [Acidithiobacillus sp.]
MRGNIIVRSESDEGWGLPPDARTEILTRELRAMSDAELRAMAARREKQRPGRRLRPVSITLPADVLERLQQLSGSHLSVSALVDRIFSSQGKP